MPITARITNLIKEGSGFRIFVDYSDGESGWSELFPFETTVDDIKERIKAIIAQKQAQETKSVELTGALVGEEVWL